MKNKHISKLRYVKAPKGCSEYLTEGKIYKVGDWNGSIGFCTKIDKIFEAFILVGRFCAHAEGYWIPCDAKGNELNLIT